MASLVNHKLYCARLVLDQAGQVTEPAPAHEALVEAAVWHLAVAYRGHLADIAASYRQQASASNAVEMARALSAQQLQFPEVDELAALERRGEWPARLLQAIARLEQTKPGVESAPAETGGGLWLATIEATPTVADCRSWHQALERLVAAHRERLQEW